MATHSSVLVWRIPGMGESGGLPSMGSQSRTRLKRLCSSSSSISFDPIVFQLSLRSLHSHTIFECAGGEDGLYSIKTQQIKETGLCYQDELNRVKPKGHVFLQVNL